MKFGMNFQWWYIPLNKFFDIVFCGPQACFGDCHSNAKKDCF